MLQVERKSQTYSLLEMAKQAKEGKRKRLVSRHKQETSLVRGYPTDC